MVGSRSSPRTFCARFRWALKRRENRSGCRYSPSSAPRTSAVGRMSRRSSAPACGSVGTQGCDGAFVEIHHSRLAGLRRAFVEHLALSLALDDADAATYGDPARIQVDISPPESERLTAPHAGVCQQPPAHGDVGVVLFGPGQEPSKFVRGPRVHLWWARLRGRRRGAPVGRLTARCPCLTASLSADRRMVKTYRTVRADSPPSPSARPLASSFRIHESNARAVSRFRVSDRCAGRCGAERSSCSSTESTVRAAARRASRPSRRSGAVC